MNKSPLFKRCWDAMCIKQWNIAVARMSFDDILESGSLDHGEFHWLPIPKKAHLNADPFLLHTPDGKLQVFYEDFCYFRNYGRISVMTLDHDFNVMSDKCILDTGQHLSYPFIIRDKERLFILPENSNRGDLIFFDYDEKNIRINGSSLLFKSLPLLDATITYHDNRYWLFATLRGKNSNDELHIYHSANWQGPYTAHSGNPVKKTLAGSRPAGAIIRHHGSLYRPTQNCAEYYGKSVIINKIKSLSVDQFDEEPILELKPPKGTIFNFGIHTINFSNDVIVIDGLRRIFAPYDQAKIFINKKLKKKHFSQIRQFSYPMLVAFPEFAPIV